MHWRADLIAGCTAAAIVIPKAMAYATIAGLSVQIGIVTAFLPALVYAWFGTSRVLSVSTTTTIAILCAAALGGSASTTLTALVGAFLFIAGIARLGFVANFISEPVLVGFKSGIGLVIVLDQVPKLLGLHYDKVGFGRDVVSLVEHAPEMFSWAAAFGVATLGLVFALEHAIPRWPIPLIALALATAGAQLMQSLGIALPTVGAVPVGLPELTLPRWELMRDLWPAALGIALMSFTESMAASRAFAAREDPRPLPNRELLALGMANAAGAVFGALPAGGGTSQTAVNRRAGARTRLAGAACALVALATLFFLGPLVELLPQAALAAIVIAYSIELIRPAEFLAIRKVRSIEFGWAIAACLGVMFLGTLQGILVAIVISLVALGHQAYNNPLYELVRKRGTGYFRSPSPEHPDDEVWPGLLILRIEGRLFFANAQNLHDEIQRRVALQEPRVVLLDASALFDVEYTALGMIVEGERRLAEAGIELWFAALNPEVLRVLKNTPLFEQLGRERLFFEVDVAAQHYQRRFEVAPREVGA